MRKRHLAIVPALNEEHTIASVVESLRRDAPSFDILVVDDGSSDDTFGRAESAGAYVLRHPFNLGIGGAVQSGFTYAAENGYEYMVQVDGDGQHDPKEIRKLMERMESGQGRIDMVCGSRFLVPNGYEAPRARRAGIWIFSRLLSLIVGQRVTDPTSGFRLFNRRAIELFARDYPHDYPEVEAVLMLHFHRLRMCEVPVRMYQRGGGVSSISTGKSAYYMVKVMLAIVVGLLRARPVVDPGDDPAVAAAQGI
ncbi:MAG: glycosyltransferase family 2 protein [Thermoleophilaceae bacterium]|nr:glycosyltransferase family 2 protein [Thermoleophilaceae bacterium]